jgi:hypothetical protein
MDEREGQYWKHPSFRIVTLLGSIIERRDEQWEKQTLSIVIKEFERVIDLREEQYWKHPSPRKDILFGRVIEIRDEQFEKQTLSI